MTTAVLAASESFLRNISKLAPTAIDLYVKVGDSVSSPRNRRALRRADELVHQAFELLERACGQVQLSEDFSAEPGEWDVEGWVQDTLHNDGGEPRRHRRWLKQITLEKIGQGELLVLEAAAKLDLAKPLLDSSNVG